MKSIYYVVSSAFLLPSFFSPNILLRTLFLDNLGLCYSPRMKNQVAHPLETTGMSIVYFKIHFLDRKWENKTFRTDDIRHFLNAA